MIYIYIYIYVHRMPLEQKKKLMCKAKMKRTIDEQKKNSGIKRLKARDFKLLLLV